MFSKLDNFVYCLFEKPMTDLRDKSRIRNYFK
jgi:hypothetical protein